MGKKISSELAIGVILIFAIIVSVAIYRAGSFSAAMDYLPQISKKKATVKNDPERILFATNGEKSVYKIKQGDGKWTVEIDGQQGGAYDDVFNGVFSGDGEQFAYGATDEGESFVVLNNQASEKKYAGIGQLIFSKDGVLIYKVMQNGEEFLVIGDQEGQHYSSIGEVVILDNGSVAFQAELNGERVTVIDGQVVNNIPETGTGQGTTPPITNNPPSSENTKPANGGSGSTGNSTSKAGRAKKDWVIPTTEKSQVVCTGSGCNF